MLFFDLDNPSPDEIKIWLKKMNSLSTQLLLR